MSITQLNYKVGWLFSPTLDLGLTWGLITIIGAVSFIFNINSLAYVDSIENLSTLKIPINMAHVIATIYPLFIRWNLNQISTRFSFILIIAPCLLSLILYSISAQLFYSILAYAAISHILLQQYGLTMICRAKAKEPQKTRWLDNLEMWNILLFPVLWWLSSMNSMNKSYFIENDFYLSLPPSIAKITLVLHFIIHIFYFTHIYLNKTSLNIPKLSMMIGTWVWLFFSLVIFENSFIFWSCLITIHGFIYILHSYRDYKFRIQIISLEKTSWLKLFSHPFTYLVLINLFATLWSSYYRYIPETIIQAKQNPIHIMVWWPLIIHYTLDSIIWKKRFGIVQPNYLQG